MVVRVLDQAWSLLNQLKLIQSLALIPPRSKLAMQNLTVVESILVARRTLVVVRVVVGE